MNELACMLLTGICVGSSVTLGITVGWLGLRDHREWLRICDKATSEIVEAREAATWLFDVNTDPSDRSYAIREWPWLRM